MTLTVYVTKKILQFPDGSFGKTLVFAERCPKNEERLEIKDGKAIHLKAGEWLVYMPSGAWLPVSNELFRKTFEKPRSEKGMAYAVPPEIETQLLKAGAKRIAKETGHS